MAFSWTITLWDEDVTPINHEEEGESLFGWQYKNSPRIKNFLKAFLIETNSLENVCRSMISQRWPYTAEGVQLDNIGKIIVYDRVSGMSDDEYRLFCLCKIFANQADGKPEQFLELLSKLNIIGQKKLREIYPAELHIIVTDCLYINTTFLLLGYIQPGGVMMDFIYNENKLEETLQFNDTLSAVGNDNDTGMGWSADASIGGKMSGVYRS